ncbi:MAG: hypothetical protein COT55_00980, partial [Candidatus Diapherotrites archaeon CG09_land_8_20_14_0_10_32_12]
MDPNITKFMSALNGKTSLHNLALRSGLKYDQVMRIMFELEKEKYVEVSKEVSKQYRLGEFGRVYSK